MMTFDFPNIKIRSLIFLREIQKTRKSSFFLKYQLFLKQLNKSFVYTKLFLKEPDHLFVYSESKGRPNNDMKIFLEENLEWINFVKIVKYF